MNCGGVVWGCVWMGVSEVRGDGEVKWVCGDGGDDDGVSEVWVKVMKWVWS